LNLRAFWKIRLVRFAFSGGLNTLFGWICFSTAISLGAPWIIAIIIGAILGIFFAFLTQGGITFRDLSPNRIPRFILAHGIVVGLNYLLLWAFRAEIHDPRLVQFLLLPFLAILSYLLFSRFVFRQ